MKCAVHTDVDAVAYCRNCGKPLCPACARPVREVIYCEDCLATTLGLQPPPALTTPIASAQPVGYTSGLQEPFAPLAPGAAVTMPGPAVGRASNPSVAFALGLVPGLGAVYNGEYNKALIHIVVFAAMIVGLSSDIGGGADTALGLLLTGFIFYMAFDAMRIAKARAVGQVTVDPLESWSKERPIGPIILIGLGALFLLNNFSWFAFYRVRQLWPLILIGVGVLMFRNRMGRDI
ncbi:MAG TPA: B-box zinc finger protein [Candidatus Acidoferrum sp.]|nr:B-box zinc finger protein [Candidatus Acidoferrum sp.]